MGARAEHAVPNAVANGDAIDRDACTHRNGLDAQVGREVPGIRARPSLGGGVSSAPSVPMGVPPPLAPPMGTSTFLSASRLLRSSCG